MFNNILLSIHIPRSKIIFTFVKARLPEGIQEKSCTLVGMLPGESDRPPNYRGKQTGVYC